jgi:hypothetical protein
MLAILTVATIIGMVTISIQQVFAPRTCAGCTAFKKLTHEFEKNVIDAIGDPNEGPEPHLTELLQAYNQDVQQIFIGDPAIDQARTLLQSYEQDVTSLFNISPPDGGKQLVKDFRSLTHDFEKAIPGIIIAASTDNNR